MSQNESCNRLTRNNRGRVSNGSVINNYLITIPRCDIPKQFVFDGLISLCNRLAVSQENHSITYLDSCCLNSSVRKPNSIVTVQTNEDTQTSFSNEETEVNPIKKRRAEQITREIFQRICNGTETRIAQISNYLEQSKTSENDESFHTTLTSPLETSSFSTYINNDEEWIHCRSHIHIFAG